MSARGPVDDRVDVGQMAVGVLFRVFDPHGRRAKTLLHDRVRGELHPLQAERIDRRADDRGIDARVDQRAQRHVAADSRRAVEIGDPHGGFFRLRGTDFTPRLPADQDQAKLGKGLPPSSWHGSPAERFKPRRLLHGVPARPLLRELPPAWPCASRMSRD